MSEGTIWLQVDANTGKSIYNYFNIVSIIVNYYYYYYLQEYRTHLLVHETNRHFMDKYIESRERGVSLGMHMSFIYKLLLYEIVGLL